MIWLCLLLSLSAEGIILEGSQTSYAQFPQWLGDVNSTIELSFRTKVKDALLLYTDNIEYRDFAQLTLIGGAKVRLRYNWNGARNGNRFNVITVGVSPSEEKHRVSLIKNGVETSLIVDGRKESLVTPLVLTSTQSSSSPPPSPNVPYQFGDPVSNSFVYVGGLPTWYGEKLEILTLPTATLEPRFRGEISDIKFKDSRTKIFKTQEVLAYKGVRASTVDACDYQNPCLNGGLCISTDSGPICDCSNVDFIGINCETKKEPLEGTFRHGEYITYDLQQRNVEPIISTNDDISLFFKTRKSSGLLFYTGNGNDYMNLGIKDGGVALTVQLGTGKLDTQIKPSTVRFNDNAWHQVRVSRKSSEVTLTVDGLYNERWVTSGSFSVLASTKVFVAGSEATYSLPGTKSQNNLVGCLKSVIYTADSLVLDLLSLAENDNQLLSVIGDVEYKCHDIAAGPPLPYKSYNSEESSSNMASIYMMQKNLGGIISFTTQESFLVLPSWKSTISGSISLKFRTNEENGILLYNGGNPHKDYFAIELLDGHLHVHLDLGSGPVKIRASRVTLNDGAWHNVELTLSQRSGRIIIDEDSEAFKTPGEANQLDLVGNLYVGGVDYMDPYLKFPPTLWSVTLKYGFVGCLRDLYINGASIDIVSYAHQQDVGSIRSSCHKMPDQCHDRPCNHGGKCGEGWNRFICDCSRTSFVGATCGYAAATTIFKGTHSISLSYPDGTTTEADNIILRFRTMEQNGILLTTRHDTSQDKFDLTLESGRIKITFQVGHSEKTVFAGQSLNDDIYHTILLQRRGTKIRILIDDDDPINTELMNSDSLLRYSQINIGGINHGDLITSSAPGFKGRMQQLIINSKNIFELIKSGQISNHKMNAVMSKDDNQMDSSHDSVSFTAQNTYIGLPQMKAYNSINIRFRFRTFEQNGLLMYNAGKASDFIAIELINGRLHYTLNLGYGSLRIKDNAEGSLSDNEWHKVVIGRPSRYRHTLMVDGHIASSSTRGDNYHLDLDGILFLGGVRQNMYAQLPRILLSKSGFQGCFGGLETNGETIDPIKDALVPSALVEDSCEDAVSYQWGSGNIIYEYPSDKRPDTNEDTLSLGLITPSFDAILVRIDSFQDSSRPGDFMQLEINGGKVYMNYNLGSKDITIGDMTTKVNDGDYHVIRFSRNGANSTLQVDDKPVIQKFPQGNKHLTVFNDQATISIGGKLNLGTNRVERSFLGVIAGVVYNGLRPLELVATGEAKVKGNVKELDAIPFDYRDKNPNLFSKEAIRKMIDKVYQPNGGEDQNTNSAKAPGVNGFYNCDDEEDCQPGSGSGDSSWIGSDGDDDEEIIGLPPRGTDLNPYVPMSAYTTSPNEFEDYTNSNHDDDLATLIFPEGTEDPFLTPLSTDYVHPTLLPLPQPPGRKEEEPLDVDEPVTGYEGFDEKWNIDDSDPSDADVGGADPPPVPTKTLPATMVLVIGIILGAFVAMVLIVIIVLKMRTRVEGSVKCETAEAAPRYQFAPPNDYGEIGEQETATTSLIDGGNGLFNSYAVNGDRSRLFRKSNGSKPVREWYV